MVTPVLLFFALIIMGLIILPHETSFWGLVLFSAVMTVAVYGLVFANGVY